MNHGNEEIEILAMHNPRSNNTMRCGPKTYNTEVPLYI
jgi:hypothetical protein